MAQLKNLIVNGTARILGPVYASVFKGSLDGNAATATKATQDANGNVITSTYAKSSSLTSHTGSTSNPHSVTKSQVGLGNVGNFKAVSTVASQGLTDTEKSNARTNIGAGTSSLAIGTTASTAAAGNHTHTASAVGALAKTDPSGTGRLVMNYALKDPYPELQNLDLIRNWRDSPSSSYTGFSTGAVGQYSANLGSGTWADGDRSLSVGCSSLTTGYASVAMGCTNAALGYASIAMGQFNIAAADCQTVVGRCNEEDIDSKYAFIVGNGERGTPSNAFAVGWDGAMATTIPLFKVISTTHTIPSINAHSYVANTSVSLTIPTGYKPVGIVGWSSGNYRIYASTLRMNNDNTVGLTLANASASNYTAGSSAFTIYVLCAQTGIF